MTPMQLFIGPRCVIHGILENLSFGYDRVRVGMVSTEDSCIEIGDVFRGAIEDFRIVEQVRPSPNHPDIPGNLGTWR